VSERVGGAIGEGGFDSSPCHPGGKARGIVIAATGPFLEGGHATEFSAPNDQGVFQKSSLLEVGNEGGCGLV
jgi:hypothetical protein